MKVLHINQSDISGGAAIAGYRLHQGLLGQGADSRLLVWRLKTSSDRVDSAPRLPILDKLTDPITQQLGLYYINKLGTFNIPKHSFYKNADVLNFHVLHGASSGYFNYLAIPSLTKRKPAVFTFHDMWSFTGHCAYSYDCDRWKSGCGKCPDLDTYPAIPKDNTHIEWKLKNWAYSHSNLTIVTPSRWLGEQAKQSMLNRFGIHHIPYGINTEVYQPLESKQCKSLLGIPTSKKVLMFAATNLAENRKGGDLLLKALQSLPQSLKAESVVLTFGSGGETIAETVGIPALNLGYASNDRFKAIAYSAADLFLFPTRADNLPLVLQESMACGTPMVSFKIGGVPDLVRPGITGYLAQPEDTQDFCNGIVQLLEDKHLRETMAQQCRAIALEEYSIELQAQRYIDLYHQVLQN
ncbi:MULTISPECIES: glycosyltransferase family 4 protein [unclassified Moorena]|uniref:glycosyltransferase family 4 protein n=1 Tax=unclassified Moorena TaxID=2683338 RepID=UPI0013B966D8|nr:MULTISPECIES: glycosyltransferase family 4 protein [unclassified Moorena]NEQ04537.1 glycosyltransferase [Moorena sp. SIO4E2]NES40110.1 glycosyltransferase [Moorena sp. SIO2C4]